jgi:hypothetical protein
VGAGGSLAGRPRGPDRAGPAGAIRRPAQVLREAHQERPARLGDPVSAAAAVRPDRPDAARGPAPGPVRARTHPRTQPAGRAGGASRSRLSERLPRWLAQQDRLRGAAPTCRSPCSQAFRRGAAAAPHEAIGLYPGGHLDFAALAEDISAEIRTVEALDAEIARLDERIASHHAAADPEGIFTSAPGIGPVLAPAILGRIGDLDRFANQASIRAFTGLVPSTAESGKWAAPGKITKAGDPGLRHALFLAADIARQHDPTLAAKYRRLVVERGQHHNSAICHLAATLVTRLAACWRAGKPYEIRDLDGQVLTLAEGRQICAERYKLRPEERARIKKSRPKAKTGQVTTGVA